MHILKFFFLILFFNIIVGCTTNNSTKQAQVKIEQKKDTLQGNTQKKLPRTVKEAVAQILDKMSEKDKEIVRATKEYELIKFHFGWGTGIRNSFHLWGDNEALLKT